MRLFVDLQKSSIPPKKNSQKPEYRLISAKFQKMKGGKVAKECPDKEAMCPLVFFNKILRFW